MRTADVIAELAAQARAAARAQPRQLVAMVVGVPPGMELAPTECELRAALSRVGCSGVEVRAEPRTGALRIVRLEYA